MSINVSFNGSTIYLPGSYSKVDIDLGGGFPLSATGIIAIFGEAEAGAPGANIPNIANNVFSPAQVNQIKSIYRSGPIVDACNFLFSPGLDGALPSGAQAVYIYKTNASVRAQLSLANSWGNIRALEWGTGGNKLTFKNTLVPANSAEVVSSAVIDLSGDALASKTLVLRVQGGATVNDNTFTVPIGTTTRALLQTAFNTAGNWSGGIPAGVTFVVGGAADTAAIVTVTRAATSNPQREGFGRNFQLLSGTLLGTGAGSINIAAGLVVASSEDRSIVSITNKRDLIVESDTVGGNIVMKIGRAGVDNVGPQVTVNATQMLLINDGVTEHALNLADFGTVTQMIEFINSSTAGKWMAVAGSVLFGQLPCSVFDRVSALGANASALSASLLPAQIKKDAYDVKQMLSQSSSVALVADTGAYCGLMDALAETYLAGGALGATSTASITNALAAFQKIRVNSLVPLFSRDASADIADALTDAASSYTIAGIHQAAKSHVSLMSTTKNRSERQAYLSMKDSYENCKLQAQNLADARCQLTIQDIRQIDSDGAIMWFQPWAAASLLAGARGGASIGLPMTGKFFNMSGLRHTAQPMATAEEDIVQDFDPDTQYDDAIQNGITFWQHPQSGGYKLVVDNTTYGKDANWVYNRANVMYAADVLAFDFRTQLENIYIGVKNTLSAAEVKSTCESILATYLAQGITVSTSDAKNGYKGLVVQINGNTINISVVVKLVEGIDFALLNISLQRAQQTA